MGYIASKLRIYDDIMQVGEQGAVHPSITYRNERL